MGRVETAPLYTNYTSKKDVTFLTCVNLLFLMKELFWCKHWPLTCSSLHVMVACYLENQKRWQSFSQQLIHMGTLKYWIISHSFDRKLVWWWFYFQGDDATCHIAKRIKAFLPERHIKSMTWPSEQSGSKSNWKFLV